MQVYQWSGTAWVTLAGSGPFPDSTGWNQPQYYSTIQTADLDGDGKAEVLARSGAGMQVYQYNGNGGNAWNPPQTGLNNVPQLTDNDPNANSLWQQPFYYGTIQTADIDGKRGAELLARGTFGMRTWRLVTGAQPTWSSYLPYGFPSPSFPTAGQQLAYTGINALLGKCQSGFDIRTYYAGAPTNGLANAQGTIARYCGVGQGFEPPVYPSCTVPSKRDLECIPDGITQQDWTTVSNAIVAELFYAESSFNFYTDLQNATSNNEFTQYIQFQTYLQTQLNVSTNGNTGLASFFGIGGNVVQAVGTVVGGAGAGPLGAAISVVGYIMAVVSSALPQNTSPDAAYTTTVDNIYSQLTATIEQQAEVMSTYYGLVAGDWGLLKAVGTLTGVQQKNGALLWPDPGTSDGSSPLNFA